MNINNLQLKDDRYKNSTYCKTQILKLMSGYSYIDGKKLTDEVFEELENSPDFNYQLDNLIQIIILNNKL